MYYRFQHVLKFSTCFFNTARFSIACTLCRNCTQTGPIFNIVFNMHYRFQHVLKFSTCFFNTARFSIACQSSLHFKIVFNMHYRFQQMQKFSTLQISTCITDSNMGWNFQHAFSRCFQHISNMKFTYGMNFVENCVENHTKYFKVYSNHVEIFKACWKPCQKFQSVSKITVMWPLHDPFHQFWNIIAVI